MSTGFVICGACKREVHQDGLKDVQRGWRHCEDKTPLCEDAHADYPMTHGEIRGRYCEADGPAPKREEPTR